MVTGGNATVFIQNMDAALAFYTEVLGFKKKTHFGDHWATVEAGGLEIGLHPKTERDPYPGTRGSITVGLVVDDVEAARVRLQSSAARDVAEVEKGSGGSFVHFSDPDGNALYLWQQPQW